MSEASDIFEGIAALLDDAGVGTYRADGSGYVAGEVAIAAKRMPSAPDACIVVTPYAIGDDETQPAGEFNVQLRFRGAAGEPLGPDELSSAAFRVLQNLSDVQFGDVHISKLTRHSSIPMGMDDSKRWEISDNYSAEIDIPATPLRHY